MCHNPNGRMPSVIHYTWETAVDEASRIAKKEGVQVNLYSLVAAVHPESPPVTITIKDGFTSYSTITPIRRPATIEEV